MDAYLERSNEKSFLNLIKTMLIEIEKDTKFKKSTLDALSIAYNKLSAEKQESCLEIIVQTLEDNYWVEIFLLATLLIHIKDKKIVYHIKKVLENPSYPLWERLNDFLQLKIYLFTEPVLKQKYEKYQYFKGLYKSLLKEISLRTNNLFYIPWDKRTRKIVIVASLILNITHAPTKRIRYIYNCYKNMGYEVECFVCHIEGICGYWHWVNKEICIKNFVDYSGKFCCDLDGIEIKVFNFSLNASDYMEQLNDALLRIWAERPEFVFEIGDETILAGLCRPFTTVVTMGCTRDVPVTNAPIIAVPSALSDDEQKHWKAVLEDSVRVLEVSHNIHELDRQEQEVVYTKETFGIPEEAFVIVVAGNRLDVEIKEDFLLILYRLLELDKHFVIAVIGECKKFQSKVASAVSADRIYFLGAQVYFKETIAIGDVFLNPPRQGGGSGGLFAVMEGVPVITLDDCDVAANVGEEFVCASIEDMPSLVYKYFTDQHFMQQQREYCKRQAERRTGVNGEKNFWKLREAVREYAVRWEEDKIDTF